MTVGPDPGAPGSHAGALVQFQELTKDFPKYRALHDISLSCQPGTITGVIGPPGSGKSVLLRLAVELLRPSSGSVSINQQKYSELDNPSSVIGFAFADQQYHPGRTGREHLRVQARALGFRERRVNEVLQLVGLTNVADRRAKGYSATIWHRLGLGLALLANPATLLLDQAEINLASAGRDWLGNLLREFASEGRTIITCARSIEELPCIPDQIALLQAGELRFSGDAAQLQQIGAAPLKAYSATPTALISALSSADIDALEMSWGALVSSATATEVEAACNPTGVEVQVEPPSPRPAADIIAEILATVPMTMPPLEADNSAQLSWPKAYISGTPRTEGRSLPAVPSANLAPAADPVVAATPREATLEIPLPKVIAAASAADEVRDAEAEAFFESWTKDIDEASDGTFVSEPGSVSAAPEPEVPTEVAREPSPQPAAISEPEPTEQPPAEQLPGQLRPTEPEPTPQPIPEPPTVEQPPAEHPPAEPPPVEQLPGQLRPTEPEPTPQPTPEPPTVEQPPAEPPTVEQLPGQLRPTEPEPATSPTPAEAMAELPPTSKPEATKKPEPNPALTVFLPAEPPAEPVPAQPPAEPLPAQPPAQLPPELAMAESAQPASDQPPSTPPPLPGFTPQLDLPTTPVGPSPAEPPATEASEALSRAAQLRQPELNPEPISRPDPQPESEFPPDPPQGEFIPERPTQAAPEPLAAPAPAAASSRPEPSASARSSAPTKREAQSAAARADALLEVDRKTQEPTDLAPAVDLDTSDHPDPTPPQPSAPPSPPQLSPAPSPPPTDVAPADQLEPLDQPTRLAPGTKHKTPSSTTKPAPGGQATPPAHAGWASFDLLDEDDDSETAS